MVTPKVNETKRGSAHKAAGAGTPASAQPAQPLSTSARPTGRRAAPDGAPTLNS